MINNKNILVSSLLQDQWSSSHHPTKSFSDLLKAIQSLPPIKPIAPVKSAFIRLKSNLELSDTFQSTITQHHSSVRNVMEKAGPKTKLIGSLQRKTRIHPRNNDQFDIDILVIMGGFTGWSTAGYGGVLTSDATWHVNHLLSQNGVYRNKNPKTDDPTVLFYYDSDVKVELVPAFLDNVGYSHEGIPHAPIGRAYWVPKDGKWELADYDYDAAYISVMNDFCEDYLIPTIKMLKAIKNIHFPNLNSMYLEILATEIIPSRVSFRKNAGMEVSYPSLITDFFNIASNYKFFFAKQLPGSLTPPISPDISTSINLPIKFKKISTYISEISRLSQTDQLIYWKKLFGEHFTLE